LIYDAVAMTRRRLEVMPLAGAAVSVLTACEPLATDWEAEWAVRTSPSLLAVQRPITPFRSTRAPSDCPQNAPFSRRLLPELTIDVANYGHVRQGPGVVLIGRGADYFKDEGEGAPGLLHNRKRAGLAPDERLSDLARRTLHAASLLERDLALTGKIKFATNELFFGSEPLRRNLPAAGKKAATS
jgi:hypothetical protein